MTNDNIRIAKTYLRFVYTFVFPPKIRLWFLFMCPRAIQDTIYEIYKRNIAQIVIKNVRKRTKESKQKKQKQK